jgi:hypothetical protein
MENGKVSITEAVNPAAPMNRFDEFDLEKIWETQGMKYAADDFYNFCRDRGMLAHYRRETFRQHFYNILMAFLVRGESRTDPRFRPPTLPRKVV